MADEKGIGRNRPVKVVMFSEKDDLRKPPGGGSTKIFDGFGQKWRDKLLNDLDVVAQALKSEFIPSAVPGVVRVSMRPDALAKSHRPTTLLSDTPIIGCEDHGNLLISVRNGCLGNLKRKIAECATKIMQSNISAIDHFSSYTPDNRLSKTEIQNIWPNPRKKQRIKVRLFDYFQRKDTVQARKAFAAFLCSIGIDGEELDYGVDGLHLFSVTCSALNAEKMRRFIAVQSIQPFARFMVFPAAVPCPQSPPPVIPPPEPTANYPIVGLIDTGVSPAVKPLTPWIVERDASHTPLEDQCNEHGTFIAGLIANAKKLNDNEPKFPSAQAKILDVVAIPQPSTPLYEDDLIQIIDSALTQHKGKAFIWNLSANKADEECRHDSFSHFAMALDSMQKRHGVLFVISAGNTFTKHPWPDNGNRERISPPADSMLALTVGSVAHKHNHSTLCKSNQPSPFTRKGCGPGCIPKPEVAHYGGNCDANGNHCETGIKSIGLDGSAAQGVGTSYAAPLVALITAAVHHSLEDPNRLLLSKALVVHSAMLNSTQKTGKEINNLMPYMGFGIPADVDTILNCEPWQATMVFQPELDPLLRTYAKAHFPIPDCLRTVDGKVKCGMVMTTVYEPYLLAGFGAEYSRVEIESALGVIDDAGKFHGKVPLNTDGLSALYEEHRIEHGFKWAPVRVHSKKFPRGIDAQNWEIQVRATSRDDSILPQPQKAVCVVTLYDLLRKNQNVYNEVVQTMTRNGWIHQDIQITPRIRNRP